MEWVEILFTYDEIEAEIVQDLLEGEGIEVELRTQRMSAFPVNVCSMGEVRLMVREVNLKRARTVLEVMKETDDNKDTE